MGLSMQDSRFLFHSRTNTQPACRRVGRDGVAAVEFAVVLPIIVLILVASLEIASSLHLKSVLQNASREGVRHAIVPRATSASVSEACQASLDGNGVRGAEIRVSPDPTSAKSGTLIQVTISASASENAWIPKGQLMGNSLFTSTTTMRKE